MEYILFFNYYLSIQLDWYPIFYFEIQNGMRNMQANNCPVTEHDIEEMFNKIDTDRSGYITLREAKKAHKMISERFKIDKVLPFKTIIICKNIQNNRLQGI